MRWCSPKSRTTGSPSCPLPPSKCDSNPLLQTTKGEVSSPKKLKDLLLYDPTVAVFMLFYLVQYGVSFAGFVGGARGNCVNWNRAKIVVAVLLLVWLLAAPVALVCTPYQCLCACVAVFLTLVESLSLSSLPSFFRTVDRGHPDWRQEGCAQGPGQGRCY